MVGRMGEPKMLVPAWKRRQSLVLDLDPSELQGPLADATRERVALT